MGQLQSGFKDRRRDVFSDLFPCGAQLFIKICFGSLRVLNFGDFDDAFAVKVLKQDVRVDLPPKSFGVCCGFEAGVDLVHIGRHGEVIRGRNGLEGDINRTGKTAVLDKVMNFLD